MKVREIMTKDLLSVERDVRVRDLVFLFASADVSGLPVVDDDGLLVGFISEEDLVRASLPRYVEMLPRASFIPDVGQVGKRLAAIADDPIEKYMRRDVVYVHAEDESLKAAHLMIRKGVRTLPVVDGEGRLVGHVKRIDVLERLL
jgi:CBS domain-containing protein